MSLLFFQLLIIVSFALFKYFYKLSWKQSAILLVISEIISVCYYYFSTKNMLFMFFGLAAILGVYISYIDIKTLTISPYCVGAMVFIGIITSFLRTDVAFYNPIIVGLVMLFAMWILCKLTKGQIGGGDVKLIAAYAVIYGFPYIINLLFYSLLSCLIFGLIVMIVKHQNMKTELPFAPFMLAGAIVFDILTFLG